IWEEHHRTGEPPVGDGAVGGKVGDERIPERAVALADEGFVQTEPAIDDIVSRLLAELGYREVPEKIQASGHTRRRRAVLRTVAPQAGLTFDWAPGPRAAVVNARGTTNDCRRFPIMKCAELVEPIDRVPQVTNRIGQAQVRTNTG